MLRRVLWTALMVCGCGTPVAETCSPQCAPGYQCQSGVCVPGGGIDMAVPDGGGNCTPACAGLTPFCNGGGHCVGCTMDAQCPNGHYCKVVSATSATCVIGCMSDDRCGGGTGKCCNGGCADTATDPANCGQCAKACSAANQQSTCAGGQCQPGACDAGWGDCDGNPANGCEANLHIDPNNCTACGMKCAFPHANSSCADGCYISACVFGFDNCDNDMNDANGCETSVLTDANNCGACGQLCKGLPNATANCAAGNCVLGMCNMGFADCDMNPMNGCEVNFLSDPKNCGACGNVCPMNLPGCTMGACSLVQAAVYSDNFVNGQTPTPAQCTKWQQFIATLGNNYSTVTMSGTFDNVGITCNNPAVVNAYAQALKNQTAYTAMCNGHSWSNCNRYNDELWIDPPM